MVIAVGFNSKASIDYSKEALIVFDQAPFFDCLPRKVND